MMTRNRTTQRERKALEFADMASLDWFKERMEKNAEARKPA